MVDCSIGTPCDPPLPAVVDALATSGTERGYPASAGSPQLRDAAAAWLARRFGAGAASRSRRSPPASAPRSSWPRCRTCSGCADPDRDTVLYPAVSYPTYAMGAELAGCRAVPVPRRAGPTGRARPRRRSIRTDAARALVLWSNSPSNPTGGLGDLGAEAAWGRAHGIPVFSDECYAEFTWDGPPRSVLEHGPDGVVAVHSLSKRSNLAGVRVGFYAGDAELVEFLRAVRQHAGLMVPGPAQAAGVGRPGRRRPRGGASGSATASAWQYLAAVLGAYGCPVLAPRGRASTSGCRCPAGRWTDAWAMAEALARDGGHPGRAPATSTASDGAGHVRVAVVQPMERLALVARPARWGSGAPRLGCAMADLQASIEELWERRARAVPGGHRRGGAGRGGHRAARHGPGPGGRGRPGDRRGRRARVAQEVDPDALLAARHGDDRARAVRVRRQAARSSTASPRPACGRCPARRPAGAPSSAAASCSCPPT